MRITCVGLLIVGAHLADCLFKLGLLTEADYSTTVLLAFNAYLGVCRTLQRVYVMEPAGSHGVWSLDDYHLLPFLFGSAQLYGTSRRRYRCTLLSLHRCTLAGSCRRCRRCRPSRRSTCGGRSLRAACSCVCGADHKHIRPRSIHSAEVMEGFRDQYMYLGCIQFIMDVKSGAPFAEHSPMLNDISNVKTWKQVNDGLKKMYLGEVGQGRLSYAGSDPLAVQQLYDEEIVDSITMSEHDRKYKSGCTCATPPCTPPCRTRVYVSVEPSLLSN